MWIVAMCFTCLSTLGLCSVIICGWIVVAVGGFG